VRTWAFLLLFSVVRLCAQVSPFETVWGQTQHTDLVRSVKQLSSGSIFTVGFSGVDGSAFTQATLHKLTETGQPVWTIYFGDSLNDYGLNLQLTQNGQLLICGETQTAANGNDAFISLFDTAGTQLWRYTYGGALNESAKSITETADGFFVATGYLSDGNGSNDVLILRTDAAGNQIALYAFGNSDNDYGQAIQALPDSGCIVAGDTRDPTNGDYNILCFRLDKNDNVLWMNSYGDTHVNGSQGLTLLSDGTFIVCGESHTASSPAFDFSFDKIDLSGAEQWRSTFGGAGSDAAFSVLEVYGGYLLCGYSSSYSPGPISAVIARTDTAGNLLWARSHPDSSISILYELIPSLSGNYLTAGNTNNGSDDQCLLLHADAAGWTFLSEVAAGEEVFAYPNPGSAAAPVLVLPQAADVVRAEVFSASGQLVFSKPVYTTIKPEDELRAGVYIVKLYAENGAVTTLRWILL
jgi:hypothetical protein